VSAQAIDQLFVSSTALRSVNFFNGRLLTGDDLSREQRTQEARLERLGRMLGSGVADGLEVVQTLGTSTDARPVVTVSAGLALAPSGQAIELTNDVDIALYRSDAPAGAEPGALFADCQPFAPGTYTAGAGVYVLTIAPTERGEGRAEVNGLGNAGAPCNVALEAEAVKFRLIRLALDAAELSDKEHLRNHVAYQCFGTDALKAAMDDPFGPPVTSYGLIDTLRTATMTADEVPLATIGWSIDDGIEFVDLWSVRRRVGRDRQSAEHEAIIFQFQAQIADIVANEGGEEILDASARFDVLPPIGWLPLAETTHQGFGYRAFFADLPYRDPVFIEGAHIGDLMADASRYPPIRIADGEAVWLYIVRQNQDAVVDSAAHSALLFTSGHLRYRGDARNDLAYWNAANYAEID
jgi:hypothetical protein